DGGEKFFTQFSEDSFPKYQRGLLRESHHDCLYYHCGCQDPGEGEDRGASRRPFAHGVNEASEQPGAGESAQCRDDVEADHEGDRFLMSAQRSSRIARGLSSGCDWKLSFFNHYCPLPTTSR